MQSKTENHTMRVFYLLAIVFVVDGHTTLGNLFDLNGLFRYYSFHLMMFAFGSGYFFKFYGGALSDFAHRCCSRRSPTVSTSSGTSARGSFFRYFSRRFSTRVSAACPCDGTKTKS